MERITWSDKVKQKDGMKCVKCGSTENLQAHHIKPSFLYPECRNDVDNGVTLCFSCHHRQHAGHYAGYKVLQINGIDPDPENRMPEYMAKRKDVEAKRQHIVWAVDKHNYDIVIEAAKEAGMEPRYYIAEAVFMRLNAEGFCDDRSLFVPEWAEERCKNFFQKGG